MKTIATLRHLLPALAAGTALALLAGCPSQSTQQTSAPSPTARAAGFHGVAFGGRQPITGATIVAYEQGLPPTEIGSDVTDSNGQFSMTFSPTPQTGQIVYVTAIGGNGGGSIGPNAAIGLMTIAGAYCTSSAPGCNFPDTVNIDELTTVAATAVLKDYLSFEDCSTIAGNTQSGECPLLENTFGLESMARTFARLANVANGQASTFLSSASQTAGAPLRATREKLDTLASILAACVNGAGPGDTKCTGLFGAMLDNPTDTLRAAWEIAALPGITAKAQTLYGLTPQSPVFSPVLTTAPAGIAAEFWNVGGDRYAFTANSGTGNISAWRTGVRTGSPDIVSGSPFPGGQSWPSGSEAVAVDPTGRYVYVVNYSGDDISAFLIGDDGTLTEISGSPFPAGDNEPNSITVDPSGHYAYVTNADSTSHYLSGYAIGADGSLSAISPGGRVLLQSVPTSVAVDPSDQYVYVTSADGVNGFIIGAGGVLTEITGTFAAGTNPVSITVDPSGRYVYVANKDSNNISAYGISTNGDLYTIGGSPFAAGTGPVSVAVDPAGQYVYVANEGSKDVSAYAIGYGALNEISGSPFNLGDGLVSIAVDPSGRFVFVAGEVLGDFFLSIDAGGTLSENAGSPTYANGLPTSVAADPSGRFVFAVNTDDTIGAFRIGSDGGFTPVAGDSCGSGPTNCFAAGNGTYSVAVDPEGRYVYAANHGDGNVSAFLIGDGGKLAEVAGSPFAAGTNPSSVVEDPSGRYVYAANNLGGGVSAYAIGAGGVLTEVTGSPFATGANPVAITITPDGSGLYVANYSGSVSAFTIGAGGVLSAVAGSPFAAGIGPFSVAASQDGQYLYVTNSGGGDLSAYAIGTGGVLTDVAGSSCGSGLPSNCFATGAGPRAITVGPLGVVYVANYDDDNISVFTIGSGGALTFDSNYAAGDGPQSVTLTSDFYVYVANSISNDISAYGSFFGSLYALPSSPFPAGGTVPVSIVTGP